MTVMVGDNDVIANSLEMTPTNCIGAEGKLYDWSKYQQMR